MKRTIVPIFLISLIPVSTSAQLPNPRNSVVFRLGDGRICTATPIHIRSVNSKILD